MKIQIDYRHAVPSINSQWWRFIHPNTLLDQSPRKETSLNLRFGRIITPSRNARMAQTAQAYYGSESKTEDS